MQKFTGLEYVKIAIANTFGHDKLTWDERIAWTDSHEIAELYGMTEDADEKYLFVKAVCALEDALEGIPTGYIMGMDATASGLQLMACFMGCEKTAANVNLIDTGKRECVYQKVGNGMGVPRSIVKHPIMTTFYGSMAQPRSVFGENTPELNQFYKTLGEELPGAVMCLEALQSCWDPEAYKYEWTLPDGHKAVMKVMATVDKKIEIDELSHATFTYRTQINTPQEHGLALAANVTHSFDGYVAREMYRRAAAQNFEILTIHDSFWCSPNNMNLLRQNYADILAEITENNYLEGVLSEILNKPCELTQYSTNLANKIRQSNYALS